MRNSSKLGSSKSRNSKLRRENSNKSKFRTAFVNDKQIPEIGADVSVTTDAMHSSGAWCVGRKPVFDLIKNKPDRIIKLYLIDSENISDKVFPSSFDKSKIQYLSKEEFLNIYQGITDYNHQGCCANINPSTSISLDQLIQRSKNNGSGIIIGLDQIQDPNNLGSIFRSAEALGADGIFFSTSKSASITPAVRRVSVGATEFLPFAEVSNIANAISKCRDSGYWIFGTSLAEGSEKLSEVEFIFPLVLMFGSEGSGLRQLTQKSCDKLVQIEQYGMTESLNVASAVSVALYAARTNCKIKLGKL